MSIAEAVSPLRQRMIEDMAIRQFDPPRRRPTTSVSCETSLISWAVRRIRPSRKIFGATRFTWPRSAPRPAK